MAKAYHREDLRRELIDAAYSHVALHGHGDLSVRKLAQLVDVSSAAPYHHFSDRRALLMAVAERGFQILREAIRRESEAATGPIDRLTAASYAFFAFAEGQSALFDLMYDSELTRPELDPELEAQYRETYMPILDDFIALTGDEEEAATRVQIYWATLFGFAFLSGRGMRGKMGDGPGDTALLRSRVVMAAIGISS